MHDDDTPANSAGDRWRRVDASEDAYVARLARSTLTNGETLTVTALYAPGEEIGFVISLPSQPVSAADLFEIGQAMLRTTVALNTLSVPRPVAAETQTS